ncbi:translin-associated factor X-interacting protein 1 isoform X4 [Octodon degus]|uniref:Translin-associated factor X-interacting protein 1 isoform X4 n=1 Tax=Octodon degus TaxID=10160 RepID=A0A6P6DYN5_OCTDE|nr:translin-associated factor X-interacting protein 1 isoform X4 [Octodon degus]
MAYPESRDYSVSKSRKYPRSSEVTIDDSLPESKSTQKFKLSQKRKTLPVQFSVNGHLSPWPTYASCQTILQNRKPCSDDGQKRTSWQQQSIGVAKPRYLEQLENYLRKELLLLDLGTDSAQELRLQPYREVFEFFIEDFKTYKPLLSSIKNAYEVMLAHQREKIRALEPLKAKLITMSEDCNERILAMRAEEKYEIAMLKKEKMNLLKLIDKKNEEKISLQSEVSKLRKNLAEEYLHYLTERDARKILIADLNELRYQREDMSLAQAPGVWGEDPVKLTLALKMTRQDLTRTQMELNTMKANFGDVVPRRDFEMQEKTNKDLQEQGYGEAIPPFLRFDGPVQNKKPSKKDVVNLLKDAWKERLAEEQKEKFPDFFFNFLERRFGPSDAIAWAYTIFENIKLFRSNEVMSQFYAILMGKLTESVYINQKETTAQLLKEMINADSQNEGLITMEQLSTILRNTFPVKTEEHIQELMEAAGWHPNSSNADLFDYRLLFTENEEGQSEPFVQKVWEQYMVEKDEYLQELKQELGLELYEDVTLAKMRRALMTIDPTLDKQNLNTHLSWAFQIPVSEMPEDEDENIVTRLQTAMERLYMTDVKRTGPRESESLRGSQTKATQQPSQEEVFPVHLL